MSEPGCIPHWSCHTTDYRVRVRVRVLREKGLKGVGSMWEGSETNVEWAAMLSPVGELD